MYYVNEWLLFFAAIALFYASLEIGFRLGGHAFRRFGEGAYPHVSTIEAALLGLLALLLGFAFAMAMNLFDARRSLVVTEANDLQTTYLRAQLIQEPHRARILELLRNYVDARIEYFRAGSEQSRIEQALAHAVRLQDQLWASAIAVAKQNTDEVTTGYFIEALNTLIDDHSRRLGAMESHVPDVILLLLFFSGAMSIAMTGYSSGFKGQRLIVPPMILIVLTATTLLAIIDLDRPRRGFIRVSEQALVGLKAQMEPKGNVPG